ncbi:S-layer homology domain-containing protein, partial [Pseudoflavonifractor phocaeensis]|uniref:S-layer homology domain-containing protein n=1 Tax=Pseudoflavonifractor phocaeensis TaxID=1870988 RepID=UPI00195B292C
TGIKPVPTYADIDGIWSEKYIEYATVMGIIAGDGAGNFNPKDTLTAEQCAKMLLTSMGYKAEVFGFVGNSWAVNTNRYANEAGLYEDLSDITPSDPISRDDAMQMVYNAIQSPLMVRSWNQNQATGEVTEVYVLAGTNNVNYNDLLLDKFDGTIELGYLIGWNYDDVKGVWTYTFTSTDEDQDDNFDNTIFGGPSITGADDGVGATLTLKSTVDYTGFYGQQVKVIYNVQKNDVIYGVFANDSSVIVSGASGDIQKYDDTLRTVRIDDVDYKLNNTAANIDVYYTNEGLKADANGNDFVQNLAELTNNHLNEAYTFKLVDNNDDGKIDAMILTPVVVAEITYLGKNTLNLDQHVDGSQSLSLDDITIYEGYAKGDWVYAISAANSATCLPTFEKAELMTATVDGVRGDNNANTYTEYLLDGKWYNAAAGYTLDDAEVNDTVEYVTLGSTVFHMEITDAAYTTKDIAMVVTAGVEKSTNDSSVSGDVVKAKLLLADGTTTTVTVSKIYLAGVENEIDATVAADVTAVQGLIGDLVTYRVDGGDYELAQVYMNNADDNNLAGFKDYAAGDGYDDGKIAGKDLADDAIVFVLGGAKDTASSANKCKVYTGRELKNAYGTKTFGADGQVLVSTENGFNYAKVAVLVNATLPTITTGTNYGYLVKTPYRSSEDGTQYLNFTLWTADGAVEGKFETTDAPAAYPAGEMITYDVKAEGEFKNVNLVKNSQTVAVVGWDEAKGKIEFDDGVVSEIDDETIIIYVDSHDQEGAEGGSIQIGEDTIGNDGIADQANVRYVGTTTKVSMLLVDVENDMADSAVASSLSGLLTAGQIQNALANAAARTGTAKVVSLDASGISGDIAVNVGAGQTLNVTKLPTAGNTLTVKLTDTTAVLQAGGVEIAKGNDIVSLSRAAVVPTFSVVFGDKKVTVEAIGIETVNETINGNALAGIGVKTVAAGTNVTLNVELTNGTMATEGNVTVNGAASGAITTTDEDSVVENVNGIPTVTKGKADVDASKLNDGAIVNVAAGAKAVVDVSKLSSGKSVTFTADAAEPGAGTADGVVTIKTSDKDEGTDYFEMLSGADSLTVSKVGEQVVIEAAGEMTATNLNVPDGTTLYVGKGDKLTVPAEGKVSGAIVTYDRPAFTEGGFKGTIVGDQLDNREDAKTVMDLNNTEGRKNWYTLPVLELDQTVSVSGDKTTLKLSGTLTAITKDNFADYQTGISEWFGKEIEDYDAFVDAMVADDSIKAITKEPGEGETLKVAYVLVKAYEDGKGKNNVTLVVENADGDVVFAKDNDDTKTTYGMTVDISGLSF